MPKYSHKRRHSSVSSQELSHQSRRHFKKSRHSSRDREVVKKIKEVIDLTEDSDSSDLDELSNDESNSTSSSDDRSVDEPDHEQVEPKKVPTYTITVITDPLEIELVGLKSEQQEWDSGHTACSEWCYESSDEDEDYIEGESDNESDSSDSGSSIASSDSSSVSSSEEQAMEQESEGETAHDIAIDMASQGLGLSREVIERDLEKLESAPDRRIARLFEAYFDACLWRASQNPRKIAMVMNDQKQDENPNKTLAIHDIACFMACKRLNRVSIEDELQRFAAGVESKGKHLLFKRYFDLCLLRARVDSLAPMRLSQV